MEALLKKLEENQQMTEAGNGEPPKPSPAKYVSMFRIDGKPILPPLMTSEKRKQMHKYKEKAIRVEQELRERRMQISKNNDGIDDKVSETSPSSANNCSGSVSQRSQDFCEVKSKETEESLALLQNLMEGQDENEIKEIKGGLEDSYHFVNKKANTDDCKLKKLQKSETLVYDNNASDVVVANAQKRTLGECKRQLLELERKANLNYLQPKKPKFLLLPNKNKSLNSSIPTICVNPPTPVVDVESANQPGIDRESTDSLTISETPPKSTAYPDDSDESLSSLLVNSGSQSTHSSPRNKDDLDDFKKSSISAKIQKFEAISGQNSTPTSSLSATTITTTPNSSPEKNNSYAEPITACMSRSATSPSLKLLTGNRLPGSPRIGLQMETEVTQQIPLVRSTSFTLEGPSKVLIDHMRQQNQTVDENNLPSSKMTTAAFTSNKSYYSRATSDTVESKAKKVHKVEPKASRSKVQLKNSSSKLIASSTSPYNTSTSSHNYCPNVNKNKRSPYEPVQLTKNCSTSFPSSHKFSMHSRKTMPPTIAARNPIKSRNSANAIQAAFQQNYDNNQKQKPQISNNQEFLSNMDMEQKEKFLKLLAQQEEEKRKLERAFELQQKFLLEQLTKEMADTHMHLPVSSSSVPSSLINHPESAQLNISGYSLNFSQSQSGYSKNSLQSTLSSPTLSVNSSFVSISGIPPPSNTTLPAYNTSNLSPTPIVATIPSNSLVNNKTVPYSRKSGCSIAPIANAMNNTVKNLTPRRRLFAQNSNTITTPSQTNPLVSIASLRKPESFNTVENNIGAHTRERRTNSVLADYYCNDKLIDKAATKINACARGFLVRRLFRTEQIQRIVRIIRDTLTFVINLHFETCENPEEANAPENIKLKARLLQQITSAGHSLHSVFFELSTKQRLNIIAQDRKRIKSKLAALSKRGTSRIAG